MMKFFRSIIALCSSFRSYRAYRDIALTTSLKHLLMLMVLLALVLVLSHLSWALTGIDEFTRRFDERRPTFAIRDGKVETSITEPVTWGDERLQFALEPTGTAIPNTNALQGLLFTRENLVFWATFTNETTRIRRSHESSFVGFPNGEVNGDYFRAILRMFLWVLAPISWLLLILVGMLTCLLQAYLFSLAASLMERSMPEPLQLNQLLNISIHAVTPAAIIVTVYKAIMLHGLNLWLIYLIAYGIFLIGATNACRGEDKPNVQL